MKLRVTSKVAQSPTPTSTRWGNQGCPVWRKDFPRSHTSQALVPDSGTFPNRLRHQHGGPRAPSGREGREAASGAPTTPYRSSAELPQNPFPRGDQYKMAGDTSCLHPQPSVLTSPCPTTLPWDTAPPKQLPVPSIRHFPSISAFSVTFARLVTSDPRQRTKAQRGLCLRPHVPGPVTQVALQTKCTSLCDSTCLPLLPRDSRPLCNRSLVRSIRAPSSHGAG